MNVGEWIYRASDLVATLSLAILAIVFGLLPARRAMLWNAKRYEVVLIWTMAAAHRLAELLHAQATALDVHVASAAMSVYSAATALRGLARRSP